MLNSGSYFIILVGLILFKVISYIVNKIAVKFARYKLARNIGMWVYSPSLLNDLKNEMLKLFLESYFDLANCSLMNILAFFEKT